LDSDKIGIIRESEFLSKSGAQYLYLVDDRGIYDYLIETKRSSMANPLTNNTLFAAFPEFFARTFKQYNKGIGMAAASMSLLGLVGGCVAPEPPKAQQVAPVVIVPIAKPITLSVEADSALKAAEQSVIEARVKRALWTAAVEQLNKARAAAQILDSSATLAHAKEVVALCALSIKQTALPPVKW
jgi:hypothetical protein